MSEIRVKDQILEQKMLLVPLSPETIGFRISVSGPGGGTETSTYLLITSHSRILSDLIKVLLCPHFFISEIILYLFLAVLGLSSCGSAWLRCCEGLSLAAVHGFSLVASLRPEHRLLRHIDLVVVAPRL